MQQHTHNTFSAVVSVFAGWLCGGVQMCSCWSRGRLLLLGVRRSFFAKGRDVCGVVRVLLVTERRLGEVVLQYRVAQNLNTLRCFFRFFISDWWSQKRARAGMAGLAGWGAIVFLIHWNNTQ